MIGRIIIGGCFFELPFDVIDVYDVLFLDDIFKEGVCIWLMLVPILVDDLVVLSNLVVWEVLFVYDRSVVCAFSD